MKKINVFLFILCTAFTMQLKPISFGVKKTIESLFFNAMFVASVPSMVYEDSPLIPRSFITKVFFYGMNLVMAHYTFEKVCDLVSSDDTLEEKAIKIRENERIKEEQCRALGFSYFPENNPTNAKEVRKEAIASLGSLALLSGLYFAAEKKKPGLAKKIAFMYPEHFYKINILGRFVLGPVRLR